MLSQLLRVMASLLECARHAPEVPLMAARSLECVWLVRYNDDACTLLTHRRMGPPTPRCHLVCVHAPLVRFPPVQL